MSCYFVSVIINKHKVIVIFNIHLTAYISAGNRILALVPPYMRVAADLMVI